MYQCKEIKDTQCLEWVQVSPSALEALAITKQQAYDMTIAICALLLFSFIAGLIGRHFLKDV